MRNSKISKNRHASLAQPLVALTIALCDFRVLAAVQFDGEPTASDNRNPGYTSPPDAGVESMRHSNLRDFLELLPQPRF